MDAKQILAGIDHDSIFEAFDDVAANAATSLQTATCEIKFEDMQKVAERIIAAALPVIESDKVKNAKTALREALPYLRYAIELAKKADGQAHLAIVSCLQNNPNKQLISSFECDEFFADLETVCDAEPQSDADNDLAAAAEFMDTHGIVTIKLGESDASGD